MSLRDSIRGFLFPDWEPRQLTPQQVWGSGGIWRPVSAAGVPVSAESAMKAAQGACIRLLADDIAALPIDAYQKRNGRAVEIDKPQWLVRPGTSRWYTRPVFISELVVSLLSDGNDFVRGFPNILSPTLFYVLPPETVQCPDGSTGFRVGAETFTENDIMHIPWVTLAGHRRGLSVIEAAEDTTGLEIAARQWESAFFRNGGTIGTTITVPGGPETVDADGIRQVMESRHAGPENWWRPMVLTGGATKDDGTISPKEADLEPLWRHVLEEAARIYHIPPHMLASQQSGAASYASVEQKSIEYVQHAIVTVTTRLEAALSQLLPGEDTYIKFNTNALLRGDVAARGQYYGLMLQSKVMTREEVREKEDLPYIGDLGWLETPNNTGDAEPAAEEPQQNAITISDIEVRDEAAAVLTERIAATVDARGERHAADLAQLQTDLLAKMQEMDERHRAEAAATRAELAAAQAAMKAEQMLPADKVMIRDERGRISGVIEKRGDLSIRRVIERDEVGNVVRISEVAA